MRVNAAYSFPLAHAEGASPTPPPPRSAVSAGPSKPAALLVTAHPDDEAMFFAPTLLALARVGVPVTVLCLSTGDADGLGRVRSKELERACEVLNVPRSRVELLDDPDLRDGFRSVWPAERVAAAVAAAVKKHGTGRVITFDARGVSGHPNHIATHRGVRLFLRQQKELLADKPEGRGKAEAGGKAEPSAACKADGAGDAPLGRVLGWQLTSTNLLRKFSGVLDIVPSLMGVWDGTPHPQSDAAPPPARGPPPPARALCFVTPNVARGVEAMSLHVSQFVWYRRLFVLFARYSYVNTLAPLPPALAA